MLSFGLSLVAHVYRVGASSSRISQQQHQQQALANTRPHEDEDGINQLDSEISSDSEEEDDSFQKTGLPDNLPDLTRKVCSCKRSFADWLNHDQVVYVASKSTKENGKISRETNPVEFEYTGNERQNRTYHWRFTRTAKLQHNETSKVSQHSSLHIFKELYSNFSLKALYFHYFYIPSCKTIDSSCGHTTSRY